MTTPRGIGDPDLPNSPYYNTPIPPKGTKSGSAGPAPFVADTIADQAVPLPIVYGTIKVVPHLIEKFAPLASQPSPWTTNTLWAEGSYCSSNGNAYKGKRSDGLHGSGFSGTLAPSGAGAVFHDGGFDWAYVQQLPCPVYTQVFVAALCEGEIAGEQGLWWDKEKLPSVASKGLVLHTGPDGSNQSLASESASYDTSGYQHTALIAASDSPQLNCFTGTQTELPDMAVEVIGLKFGATTPDASPADVVNDILTSFRRGAAWAASRVDASITGTGAGGYRVYCDAAGLRFSMLMDNQRSALAWLSDILVATNSDAVWSQGTLKIKPLGDTAIPAPVYGTTGYVPANAAVYNLSTDDFLDTTAPVSYRVTPDSLIFNRWPVQYIDRQLGYVQTTVDFPDQAAADLLGVKDAGTVNLPLCFPDGTLPTMISRILVQRSGRVTVIYTFRLDWRYILIDPTDVVTLTETLVGLLGEPVRLTDIEEQADGSLQFTAESYPAGVAAATGYQPQTGSGYVSNDVATTALVPTTVDGTRIGIQNGAVTAAHGTGSSYPDNLWPNPGSEVNAPAGADLTRPEWAGRFNAGTGAVSGSWVRQLSTAIHARVLLGDQQAAPATDQSQLGYFVPCSPGDQFYIESLAKILTGASGEQAGVYIWFLDANNNLVGSPSTFTFISASSSLRDPDSFLTNGDAEAGTVGVQAANWTFSAGIAMLTANDFFHSGTKSLNIINNVAANSSSYQDVSVIAGQEYTLSGWIKTTAITAGTNIGALFNVDIVSGVTGFTIVEKVGNLTGTSGQPDVGVLADGAVHDWTFVKCRFVPTGANGVIRLYCQLGFGGTTLGTAWFDDVKLGPSFAKVSAFGTAPIGTVKAMIGLYANCTIGAIAAQFDSIYSRRADLAPLDHARTTIGGLQFSNAWERILKAIDGEASTSGNPTAGLAFYRGGNDTTSNGGAPLIYDGTNFERVTLTVFQSCGNVSLSSVANWAQAIPLQIAIQPKTNLDNLDALRLIVLRFYSSAGTFREEIRIPITDRAYGSAGSPTNSLNALVIRDVFTVPGAAGDFYVSTPFHFNGYIRVYLLNAYGVSASLDFGPDGNAAGSNMSAHATIPGVAGTLVSGGGGSTYCPAPEALILLEDGSTVTAAELRDGMRVQGVAEGTGAPAIGTIHYAAREGSPMRYLLTLADGRQMRFSKDHRLWSVTNGEWVVVQQLAPGDVVQGTPANSTVASVAADGPGPVIGFVVEGTHTYFADGILSHNVKSSVP